MPAYYKVDKTNRDKDFPFTLYVKKAMSIEGLATIKRIRWKRVGNFSSRETATEDMIRLHTDLGVLYTRAQQVKRVEPPTARSEKLPFMEVDFGRDY